MKWYWAYCIFVCKVTARHELGTDLGSDPRTSSFYKALQQAAGVLVVLDPKATPFSRIWSRAVFWP